MVVSLAVKTVAEAEAWIAALDLAPNPEGGYYRLSAQVPMPGGGPRPLMTVIYYLLTEQEPRARLHRSSADSVHFHHGGGVLRLHSLGVDGALRRRDLGAVSLERRGGAPEPQVVVAGGSWKGIELVSGSYALISEAVVPGWSPEDHESASRAELAAFPAEAAHALARFVGDGEESGAAEVPARTGPARTGPASALPASEGLLDGPGLADRLGLYAHVEGGFFRETWGATATVNAEVGRRPLANSIYYLLTRDSPLGVFHRNVSDITHFFHSGGPIVYAMIDPEGGWHEVVLGRDRDAGEALSFTCPGGWWKSSQLGSEAEHGLISEIVAPGFDYADQTFATAEVFARRFPALEPRWRPRMPPGER